MQEQKLLNKIKNIATNYNIEIGIYAYEFNNKDNVTKLNENKIFPAASIIKLFMALSILKKIEVGELTLDQGLICKERNKISGVSILADLDSQTYKIKDLLYFLLVHSDNTAQNILEQIIQEKDINKFIKELNLNKTKFVSFKKTTKKNFSITTPKEIAMLFQLIWQNKIVNRELTELFLSYLGKTRTTYFGLRYLPCRLNVENPKIKNFYSKAGKLENTISDCLILETKNKSFQINVFIDNLKIRKYRNNVDNQGMKILGKIVMELYNFLY